MSGFEIAAVAGTCGKFAGRTLLGCPGFVLGAISAGQNTMRQAFAGRLFERNVS
jgi:hypothetical protein